MHTSTSTSWIAGAWLALAALLPSFAQAHYLWLEQGSGGSHLYFGEYEEMLRETSPGRLDEMPGPEIRAIHRDGQATAIAATREHGGFAFGRPSRDTAVVASESGYAVKDWTRAGIGIVKPMFYARLIGATAAQAGEPMTLDIVPAATGEAGAFRVLFRGAPLAGVDVRIIAPNAWTREASTDKDGVARFAFPWRGQYILHIVHLERTPGTFQGTPYEAVRHRATATLYVPNGAATQVPTHWQASAPH